MLPTRDDRVITVSRNDSLLKCALDLALSQGVRVEVRPEAGGYTKVIGIGLYADFSKLGYSAMLDHLNAALDARNAAERMPGYDYELRVPHCRAELVLEEMARLARERGV